MALPIASVVAGALIDPTTFGNEVVDALNAAPRGRVAYAEVTAQQNTITTVVDLTSLSVTWTAAAGRRYRVSFAAEINGTAAGDLAILYVSDGAGTSKKRHVVTVPALTAGSGYSAVSGALIEVPGAGSVTRKLRLERNAGSGTVGLFAAANSPAFILVEDIGT